MVSYCLLSKVVKIKTCKTIILSTVLYGYDKWSHTLKEEHKLQIFGKKIRKIFGPTSNEVQVS